MAELHISSLLVHGLPQRAAGIRDAIAAIPGAEIALALRPEALSLGVAPNADAILRGKVEEVSFLGSVVRVRAALANETDSQRVSFDTFNTTALRPPSVGDTVEISFATADALLTDA